MLQLSLDRLPKSWHNMIDHAISSHSSGILYLIHIILSDNDVIKRVPVFESWVHPSVVVCILALRDGIRNHKSILQTES